jgi:hypothetical protein
VAKEACLTEQAVTAMKVIFQGQIGHKNSKIITREINVLAMVRGKIPANSEHL